MKKFKALYKGMYDDLKDAEMMIEYAYEIKEENAEDRIIADELAKYAKYRLEHFNQFHNIFVEEGKRLKEINEKTVEHCMWHEAHEQMQEWYDSIERCITKYK